MRSTFTKEKLGVAGSFAGLIAAAILASSCCWLPLLLAGLGITGLGAAAVGFTSALAPFRPYLIMLMLALLAGTWYLTLRRRPAPKCSVPAGEESPESFAGGTPCCGAAGNRRHILVLSFVTTASLVILFIPEIAGALYGGPPESRASSVSVPLLVSILKIRGMSCQACAAGVRLALLKIPGVRSASVDFRTGSARVSHVRGEVSDRQLEDTVAEIGYSAAVSQEVNSRRNSGP